MPLRRVLISFPVLPKDDQFFCLVLLCVGDIPSTLDDQLSVLDSLQQSGETLLLHDLLPDTFPLPKDLHALTLGFLEGRLFIQELDHLDQSGLDLVHLLGSTESLWLGHMVLVLKKLTVVHVELMIPKGVVEAEGGLVIGEALHGCQRVPMIMTDMGWATGLIRDLLQVLFLIERNKKRKRGGRLVSLFTVGSLRKEEGWGIVWCPCCPFFVMLSGYPDQFCVKQQAGGCFLPLSHSLLFCP